MSDSLLSLAYQLTEAEEPFVLATVVRCERPTSARPGAQALIRANGEASGWIGGSCAQPVVIREALRLLREDDAPYLLRLGVSSDDTHLEGIRQFPMSCASGGVLDIYLEPHLPAPQLVLVGQSPVITTLKRLVAALSYRVIHIDHADLSQIAINERTAILIATHGRYDEDALERAVVSPAVYIGMVASRRRADTCREYLRSGGVPEYLIARIHAPAGLDLSATNPEEIAVSILAELILLNHVKPPCVSLNSDAQQSVEQHSYSHGHAEYQDVRQEEEHLSVVGDGVVAGTAIDPVCGMAVEVANARHHINYEGRIVYFCCPSCKRMFERNPHEYSVEKEVSVQKNA